MAHIVSNGAGGGNFTAGAAWAGGAAPVNNDTFEVVVGDTIVYDEDMSGWANGVGASIVTGELQADTAAGAYYLKLAGHLTGTGTLRAGTAGVAYPVGCTFTIELNGNFRIELTGTDSLQLYAAEPTYRYIELSGAEAAGQTVLSVDTDVTADIWADGDTIRVDDINNGRDTEEHTIAVGGIAANTITIAGGGLANAKIIGAKVILISRNVRIVGAGIGVTAYGIYKAAGGVVRAEARGCTQGLRDSNAVAVSGSVSDCSYAVHGSDNCVVSGIVSGCSGGIYVSDNCVVSGIVSGCNDGIYLSDNCVVSGIVSGGVRGIRESYNCVVSGIISGGFRGIHLSDNCTISGTLDNAIDIYYSYEYTSYGTAFSGGVENDGYNAIDVPAWQYSESFDHDGVAGAFRAWCRGGIVDSEVGVVPPGETISYKHNCADADFPCFRQDRVRVEPGATLNVTGYLRKDALMGYLPRLQIIDPYADPLVDAGNSALDEDIMTNAVDAWETLVVSWANAGSVARWVLIRAEAKDAANNVYELYKVAAGGGVSRSRIIGGV